MLLEVKDIHKSFGPKNVLKGISFSAQSGKAFGILGRNGAGKTTTIRILLDVFHADSGEILIDGKPIDRKRITFGYLPEERGLYEKKKIIDQLVYFAQLKGMSKKDAIDRCDYWLDQLDMKQYRNQLLNTLSKGNQQKIQLITAIVHNPDIIILDEPFSGLDPVNAMLLEDVVKDQIKHNKIVLFSSHQMNYIEEFCDDIVIINQGNIAIKGKINEIKRNYVRDRLVVSSLDANKIEQDYQDRCTKQEDGTLLIQLEDPKDKKEVMEQLISHYDIDEVKVYEPSLNDIFVQYAGDQKEGSHETIS